MGFVSAQVVRSDKIPLGVYIAPDPNDPQNYCNIWMKPYQFHGVPLILGTCSTSGVFVSDGNQQIQSYLPLSGYVGLKISYTISASFISN